MARSPLGATNSVLKVCRLVCGSHKPVADYQWPRRHLVYCTRSSRRTLPHQKEQAASAASKITQFIKEIEAQLGWTTHLSGETSNTDQRELDGRRLLRQVPAIAELALLDSEGRERLPHVPPSHGPDRQQCRLLDGGQVQGDPDQKAFYGPVYFRRGTEPHMTLAMAGARRDAGVSVAEVNLTHIWDVVNSNPRRQHGARVRRRRAGTPDRSSGDQSCFAQYRCLAASTG